MIKAELLDPHLGALGIKDNKADKSDVRNRGYILDLLYRIVIRRKDKDELCSALVGWEMQSKDFEDLMKRWVLPLRRGRGCPTNQLARGVIIMRSEKGPLRGHERPIRVSIGQDSFGSIRQVFRVFPAIFWFWMIQVVIAPFILLVIGLLLFFVVMAVAV